MSIVKFADKFGIASIGNQTEITTPDSPRAPEPAAGYVFNKATLEPVLLYLAAPCGDALYLTGPTGSGKTSLIHNIAAHLGWGLQSLTVGSRTEAADLIGRPAIHDGRIVFEYGALVNAMKNGDILLINEIDMMAPGELAALNDVLEGRPLTVTQHEGEVIRPAPSFRVIATANSKGDGEGYAGARLLNVAFMDRFRVVEMDYPSAKVEEAIIHRAVPNLKDANLVKQALQLATELRRVYMSADSSTDLAAPFSTRTLVRLCTLLSQGMVPQTAVDLAYASRLQQTERDYVHRLTSDVFGNGPAPEPAPETEPATADDTGEAKPRRRTRRTKQTVSV